MMNGAENMEHQNENLGREDARGSEKAEEKQHQGDGEEVKKNQESTPPGKDDEERQENNDAKDGNKAHGQERKEEKSVGKLFEEIKNASNVNIFIDQYRNEINNGFQVGDNSSVNDVNFQINPIAYGEQKTETSIAKDNKRLREWINKNYFNPSLALMITIAVFNEMPYNWIVNEKGNLYTYLPKGNEHQLDTKAVEERLEEIGAEICMGEITDYAGKREERFIRFADEEDADALIEYVWLQFPDLKMPILKWLVRHICRGRNIYVMKITKVLSKLACIDYGFFANQMIPAFYEEKNISVDITLSQILIFLNDRESKKVISMLTHWSTQKRVHPLLTVLLVARELKEESILRKAVKTYLDRLYYDFYEEDNDFYDHIIDFFAVGIRKAFFYRVLIEELYELFFQNDSLPQGKNRKIDLFLILFLIDVALLTENKGKREEAIFVKMCIAPGRVKDKLCAIWRMVWNTHAYRTEFYKVMGEYYTWLNDRKQIGNILLFIDVVLGRNVSAEAKNDVYKKIKRNRRR